MSSNDDPTRLISPEELAGRQRGLQVGQQVFGRYRLEKVAGRGGMGIVWRAKDEDLDRIVALKFLPDDVAADVEAIRDLKFETKRCLELTHPSIVRVYDFVQGPDGAAIAMEFVEGESLANRKAQDPHGCLSVDDLSRYLGQLCAALDYAHFKAHLLHRDLKPANLLVTRDGDLKVMDFGIACSIAETRTRLTAKANHSTSGTLLYMSPQQLMGEKPSVADDIYSLGATLYELLAGKPPFYRGDGYSLMMQVREKIPQTMAAHRADLQVNATPIPEIWEQVVAACLAKNPADRPQRAGEVAERLGLAIPLSLTDTSSGRTTTGATSSAAPKAEAIATATTPPPPSTTPSAALPVAPPPGKKTALFAALGAGVLALIVGVYFLARPAPPPVAAVTASVSPSDSPLVTASPSSANGHPSPGSTTAAGNAPASEPAAPVPPLASGEPRGGIVVHTDPSGAEVSVGALEHGTSPLTVREARLGRYPVRVKAAGYEDWTGEVEVKADDFTEVRASLTRSMGALLVTSDPTGLDAEVAGRTVPGQPSTAPRQKIKTPEKLNLPTGSYEVTFHRSEWPDQKSVVDVVRDHAVEANATFAVGRLTVTSEPAGATVLSGTRTLGITPLKLTEVQPGPQSLELRLAGYRPVKLAGVVVAREELRLDAALEAGRVPEAGHPANLHDLDLELEYIAPGTFAMGSANTDDSPPTQVTLTQGFWLGKTEVTQQQYEALMGGTPSKFRAGGRDAPVENVSWYNAMEFCRRLTERERAEGRLPEGYTYTLPTEAQWEYACRCGAPASGSDASHAAAWFDKDGGKTTHAVGLKTPNAWGLYDMLGNVGEWCLDVYADHLPGGSVTDYAGPVSGKRRVWRGGSWDSSEKDCRSTARVRASPDDTDDTVGFRLALSAPQTTSAEVPASKGSGFFSGVKSAVGSVTHVFKAGEKRADSEAGLTVTVPKAPPAPFRFTLTLTRTDGAKESIEFPVDETTAKGRAANGDFVAKLNVPPGNYTFVLKTSGFKDVTAGGAHPADRTHRDALALAAGGEVNLVIDLEPAKAE